MPQDEDAESYEAMAAVYAEIAPNWPGIVAVTDRRKDIGLKAVAAAVRLQRVDLATLTEETGRLSTVDWE